MTRVAARPRSWAVALWALFVAASATVAALPDDPGTIPGAWLAILAVLGVLAFRGSRTAYAVLVALNGVLLATVLLLAAPLPPTLWGFYALVAAALTALVGIPLLVRSRSAVQQLT
ncbi:hypothetical protein SAMN05660662_3026 [Blastococcus aurantiacus]|uniref:MYXO-CTERM domain-containing protein n=1 Tax=Blastococcus aurantiacus TaxID=1550231 RepID=A0A1G7N090_9ACTN|nr:hypothetical protein [Blastococcus aurantiacus]SDF67468.1 hypothetical protein SAMN05660662_3026 [Blastococcus aurantiacus]